MKTSILLAASLLAGASLALLPMTDGYTFRGEMSGYLPLIESTMECPCGPSCECENCGCHCIMCNELNETKKRGK
jgi:hypothetical protein